MSLGTATVALGATMVFDILAFAILLVGGYVTRRDAQTHKRLMLCATAVMLQPAVARLHFIPINTIFGYWQLGRTKPGSPSLDGS